MGFEKIGARTIDVKPMMSQQGPLIHSVYYEEEARRALSSVLDTLDRKHGAQSLLLEASGPRILSFSPAVWKRPWPIFEAVSMNLTSMASVYQDLTVGKMLFLRVTGLFLVPMTPPLTRTKSSLTSP